MEAVAGGGVRSAGLVAGREVLARAEELGYDVAYVRSRHLQDALSSPLMFLAALGQHLRRIELGTAVIPLRFENAARLAEDLATADLLLGGRLRPGVAPGYSAKDAIYAGAFGALAGDAGVHSERVLHELCRLLDGEIVARADGRIEGVDAGTPLRVRPQSPGLRSRLSYGAAGAERAALSGSLGLGLQLATMVPDDGSGRSFELLQREVLEAYREASRAAGHGEGHVMVSRQAIPVRSEEDLERYVSLIPRERSAAPGTTGEFRGQEIGGRGAVFGQAVIDDPGTVARALLADPVVREADELVLVLPFGAGVEEQCGVLEVFAQDVVPHLAVAL
ncbi:LLM class flavin-dependent oxidoreductase [Brachybacterium sp. DNPG3]